MDEHMGKRADAGVGFSRRGSSLSFKDPDHEDRSIQCCNRLGCSTRLNFIKGTQIGNPEKAKYSRASFRSMSHNATAESSSKSFSASSDYRKSHHAQQKQIFLQEASITESSSRQVEVEDLECSSREGEIEDSKSNRETEDLESIPTTTGIQTPEPEDLESMNATESLGSCTITSNSRPCKQINRWSRSGNQDASSSSSVRHTIASRNTGHVSRTPSLSLSSGAQRYGLKNLSCRSISDVLPSGCSSSDSGHTRRGDSVRKRFSDGKSSSVRGKDTSGGDSRSPHSCLSGPSLSNPERIMAQQASRKTRDRSTSRDGIVSVRTRRVPNVDSRIRLSEQGDETLSLPETTIIPQLLQTQFSILETTSRSSSPSITRELHPIHHNTFGRPSSSSRTARSRPVSHPEDNSTQRFHGPLGDRDGYRRFNMEGIAEVLLALERIEQDDELTYEQLLVLETNLFVGGLSSHDQHRDMRLDVDNMSYEELLALEEKMGTVSTALTEEALSKCLKRSIYTPAFPTSGITGCGDDDIKCSICQEEYAVEDEVGTLACKHRYHLACIHQWLRQKNWCPICKASASPS